MKVKQFYNKNQFLLVDNKKAIFQSYNSTIAIWDYESQVLTIGYDWDYSMTTRKHLYLFIDEFTNLTMPDKKKGDYIQKLIDDKIVKYDEALQ